MNPETCAAGMFGDLMILPAGVAALDPGWLPGCPVAYAIPVRAPEKNVFFGRKG